MPPKRANSSTESLHTSKRLASDITDEQEPQIIPKTANKMGLLCRENRWKLVHIILISVPVLPTAAISRGATMYRLPIRNLNSIGIIRV
ncbi:hypothetical protein RhiirC2_783455 [Rhizophagus irregularis]|uniref:Uncharacterized protein n=1 Tax=Rhizophagus irregularis TaxID=588596 RepID=A0A2N1N0S9_9GLOM|nr:hypothetical protein RhiirC2_783455 [Rhizophagus irregularis]